MLRRRVGGARGPSDPASQGLGRLSAADRMRLGSLAQREGLSDVAERGSAERGAYPIVRSQGLGGSARRIACGLGRWRSVRAYPMLRRRVASVEPTDSAE